MEADIIDRYLFDQDVSENSRNVYEWIIRSFNTWCILNGMELFEVNKSDFIRWKSQLTESGKSILTIGLYMTGVRKFYQWAELNGHYDDITKGVKNPKRYQGFRKQPLSRQHIATLFSSIDTSSLIGKRDMAILMMMVVQGLRAIEVERMDCNDVLSDDDGQILIRVLGKGKTEKETMGLCDGVADAIHEYLLERNKWDDGSALFASMSKNNFNGRMNAHSISAVIKNRITDAGLDGSQYSAHSLRHTCAVLMMEDGADLFSVQAHLRHTDTNMTRNYTRYLEQKRRIKNSPAQKIDKQITQIIQHKENGTVL